MDTEIGISAEVNRQQFAAEARHWTPLMPTTKGAGMKFYLAGRYERRAELAGYAAQLRALGHEVTSRWLDGQHESRDAKPDNYDMMTWACEDKADIERAGAFIAFTEDPGEYHRGGRHVELGLALNLMKTLIVIGPLENIFYANAEYVFQSFDALIAYLSTADKETIQYRFAVETGKITPADLAAKEIERECDRLKAMLLSKNRAYGNSALDPVRVFSRADAAEQIRVRLDDKLSRLMRGGEFPGDDTVLDLLGYLVLLRIASRKDGAA